MGDGFEFLQLNIFFFKAIATTTSVWTGVVITPSDKAYEAKDCDGDTIKEELEDNMEN